MTAVLYKQKNYSVVRRVVGYLRYDSQEEVDILNELYTYLGQYTTISSLL
jgi:hypothetical protein